VVGVVPSLQHEAVMVDEVCAMLRRDRPSVYVDCTLGAGGHTRALLQAGSAFHTVIGIDRDPQSLAAARHWGLTWAGRLLPVHGDFRQLTAILTALGYERVDGILLDLGVSSHQLDTAERGFSFRSDGPLDMRMDPTQSETASMLVNRASADELCHIIRSLGEERWAGRIARAIVAERRHTPIIRTSHLATLVAQAIPRSAWPQDKHPATRVFQALRMTVNGELPALDAVLSQAVTVLSLGGRIAVIAYHSLEDRCVKRFFSQEAKGCICPPRIPQCICGRRPRLKRVTRKPLRPSTAEVQRNRRSRSARLRVAERLEEG
jgi:16S rRNA (cytosine1402-N4)-methyltransferase